MNISQVHIHKLNIVTFLLLLSFCHCVLQLHCDYYPSYNMLFVEEFGGGVALPAADGVEHRELEGLPEAAVKPGGAGHAQGGQALGEGGHFQESR